MRYVGAELDLSAIDKVDVLNELRRFSISPASDAGSKIFVPYCNRRLPNYYVVQVKVSGPARPGPARPSRSVTLACHAPMDGVPAY